LETFKAPFLMKKIEKLHDYRLHNICLPANVFKKPKWIITGWTNVVARTGYAKMCLEGFSGAGLLRDVSAVEKMAQNDYQALN
jgi:hypothetical protein